MKTFTETKLEQAIIELLAQENISHLHGGSIERKSDEVLMLDVFRKFLQKSYRLQGITENEINSIIRKLESYADNDLYESNKAIMELICNGFLLKRDDPSQKDMYIYLIDYHNIENNQFHIVNQLEIEGYEKRIPDGIL